MAAGAPRQSVSLLKTAEVVNDAVAIGFRELTPARAEDGGKLGVGAMARDFLLTSALEIERGPLRELQEPAKGGKGQITRALKFLHHENPLRWTQSPHLSGRQEQLEVVHGLEEAKSLRNAEGDGGARVSRHQFTLADQMSLRLERALVKQDPEQGGAQVIRKGRVVWCLGAPDPIEFIRIHVARRPPTAKGLIGRNEAREVLSQRSRSAGGDALTEIADGCLDRAAIFIAARRLAVGQKAASLRQVIERAPELAGFQRLVERLGAEQIREHFGCAAEASGAAVLRTKVGIQAGDQRVALLRRDDRPRGHQTRALQHREHLSEAPGAAPVLSARLPRLATSRGAGLVLARLNITLDPGIEAVDTGGADGAQVVVLTLEDGPAQRFGSQVETKDAKRRCGHSSPLDSAASED